MKERDYSTIKQLRKEVDDITADAEKIKEYNIQQNYLRAVSRLCKSGIIEDWIGLNEITDFKVVKEEVWNKEVNRWVHFIDKYMNGSGKITSDGFHIAFNPATTWTRYTGGFGIYQEYGSCGNTNMLSFGPKDVDTENYTIRWHEYAGTKVNEVATNGSWFKHPYEVKTAIINELIGNYERYREYAFDTTMEELCKKREKALEAKQKAENLLTEEY